MATAAATKNAKVENDEKPINQNIVNLAAAIKADLKIEVDPSGNAAKVAIPKNMYERLLPEEVTPDMVEKVAAANADIAAALTLAVGEESFKQMKKHKGLETVTAVLPATGRDRFETTVNRSYQAPTMTKGTDGKMVMGERETRYGFAGTKFNSFGTRNVGQMAQIRSHLAKQAMDMLSKG